MLRSFTARGAGRLSEGGGLWQFVGSNALSVALATLDFALSGWRARRPARQGLSWFLAPLAYPGYRGLAVFGAGLRVTF